MYDWFTLLYSRNWRNTVNQLYSNKKFFYKKYLRDIPGGTMDKNPPCQWRGHGWDPWSGWFHTLWSNQACEPQLRSPCSRAWESKPLKPVLLEHVLRNKRSHSITSAHTTSGKSLRTATKTQCSQTKPGHFFKKKYLWLNWLALVYMLWKETSVWACGWGAVEAVGCPGCGVHCTILIYFSVCPKLSKIQSSALY